MDSEDSPLRPAVDGAPAAAEGECPIDRLSSTDEIVSTMWNGRPADAIEVPMENHVDWNSLLQRRRHAPSPPCPSLLAIEQSDQSVTILSEPPGGRSVEDLGAPPSLEAAWQRLTTVAEAIDRLHRFRLAHGALSDRLIVLDERESPAAWLRGVGIHWASTGSNNPALRDLDYFLGLCHRWLTPLESLPESIRSRLVPGETPSPGIFDTPANNGEPAADSLFPTSHAPRTTALSWLRDLRREPVTSDVSALDMLDIRLRPGVDRRNAAAVLSGSVEKLCEAGDWPRSRGLSLLAILCVAVATIGIVAYQFRSHPSAGLWLRTIVMDWYHGQPSDESSSRLDLPAGQQTTPPATKGPEALVERAVGVHSLAAVQSLLTSSDPSYAEAAAKMFNSPDRQFHYWVRIEVGSAVWREQTLPRLRQLLDKGIPSELGRSTLERIFLASAVKQDLPQVEKFAHSEDAWSRLQAIDALARLGRPLPIGELKQAYATAEPASKSNYLLLALRHYPLDQSREMLEEGLFDTRGRPRPMLYDVTAQNPDQKSLVLLNQALNRLLRDDDELFPDQGPLRALIGIQQINLLSPDQLIGQLDLENDAKQKLKASLARSLLNSRPSRAFSAGRVVIPDSWYAAAMDWSEEPPDRYLDEVLSFSQSVSQWSPDLRNQGLLLALTNAQSALTQPISKRLIAGFRPEWVGIRAPETAALLTVLAASGDTSASQFLEEFLGKTYWAREPIFWDGVLAGAALAPAANSSLIEWAAGHPLPMISIRARELLALQARDLSALRHIEPAPLSPGSELAQMVVQLESRNTAADVKLFLTQQRDSGLFEMAMAMTDSPGCADLIRDRVKRNENTLAMYYTLANQRRQVDSTYVEHFFDLLQQRTILEQPLLVSFGLHRDRRQLSAIRSLGAGEHAGPRSPPTFHEFLAIRAMGDLGEGPASLYLDVIRREQSRLLQSAAAIAFLKTATAHDKVAVEQLLSERSLPPAIRSILSLADQL